METCVSVHIWSKLFFVLFKHLFTVKHTNVITCCNMSKLGYPTQSWPDFAWISDADNDKVLMSLTKLSWSLCFASHEISFHTQQFESESSLCVMSHALCNSQQLPFFFSGFRTFEKKIHIHTVSYLKIMFCMYSRYVRTFICCLCVEYHYIMIKDIIRRRFAKVGCGVSSRYVTAPSPQAIDRQEAKSLGKLNTDEVCQWFTKIGLQKCLPFIRGIEHILPLTVSSPSPMVAYQRLWFILKPKQQKVKRKKEMRITKD